MYFFLQASIIKLSVPHKQSGNQPVTGWLVGLKQVPLLHPALIAAGIVAFLVSFENFNTTLFLAGSEAPLIITMYDRMVKVGSTPALNAVSFVLILGSALLALLSVIIQKDPSES